MSSKSKLVILLLFTCIVIAVFPLFINKESEFGGADGEAADAVSEIAPDYEVWAAPLVEPPGGETESLLFCLQAALGAGVLGYGIGTLRERTRQNKKAEG